MRTAIHKLRRIRAPKSSFHLLSKRANRAYKTMKERPLMTLGTFLALSTLSGLLVWYKRNH